MSGTRSHGHSVAYVSLSQAGIVAPLGKVGSPSRGLPPRKLGSPPTGPSALAIAEDDEEESTKAASATPASPTSPRNAGANASNGATGTWRAPVLPPSSGGNAGAIGGGNGSSSSSSGGSSSAGDLNLVEKSLTELYTTESTYVSGLNTIVNSFLLRFRKYGELDLQPRWFEPGELERLQLFNHVCAIRDINARLLKEMDDILHPRNSNANSSSGGSGSGGAGDGARMQHLARIGSTFRQFIPYFKVYSSFASAYGGDLKALEELAAKRSALAQFLTLTAACEGASLASLLITPVQRVGRYVLLLETILKFAPRSIDPTSGAASASGSGSGLSDVSLALEEMKTVAALINATVALFEATSKVVELQSKIDAPILQPGRFLVREGVLKKTYVDRSGAGGPAKQMGFFATLKDGMTKKEGAFTFFLLNDVLLQTKKSALQDRFTLRELMPLHGMQIEDVPDSGAGTGGAAGGAAAGKDGAGGELKNAWTLIYSSPGDTSAAAAASGNSSAAAGPVSVANAKDASSSSAAATPGSVSRAESVSAENLQSNPASGTVVGGEWDGGSPPSAASPQSSSDSTRKIVTLFARDADEKAKWMADLQSLIDQSSRNKATLRT